MTSWQHSLSKEFMNYLQVALLKDPATPGRTCCALPPVFLSLLHAELSASSRKKRKKKSDEYATREFLSGLDSSKNL